MIFAPGTARGLYDALHKAIDVGASVISVSWGFLECDLPGTSSPRHQSGFARRLSLGDYGVLCERGRRLRARTGEERSNSLANVNFPASSPYVLACGGTTFCRSGERIEAETVWNNMLQGIHLASGGGVSGWFAAPSYQRRVNVPCFDKSSPHKTWMSREKAALEGHRGRGVPNVAAYADFDTGYAIVVGGMAYHGFGTSLRPPCGRP